jgi:hypothetical protein
MRKDEGPSGEGVNEPEDERTSRRRLLRTAVSAAAVGAGALVLGDAKPAAADTGDDMVVGEGNSARGTTGLSGGGTGFGGGDYLPGVLVVDSYDGTVDAIVGVLPIYDIAQQLDGAAGVTGTVIGPGATTSKGIGVKGSHPATGIGVQGLSAGGIAVDGTGKIGVKGTGDTFGAEGTSVDGTGVLAVHSSTTSPGTALRSRNFSNGANSFAVDATLESSSAPASSSAVNAVAFGAGTGVKATAVSGVGVSGGSLSGNGVLGTTASTTAPAVGGQSTSTSGPTTGVYGEVASDAGVGVLGRNLAIGGVGVWGAATGFGTGLQGVSLDGRDLSLFGGGVLGQKPQTVIGPPTARPGGFAFAAGDAVRDAAGDLYLCVVGGTTGVWRKVTAAAPGFQAASGSVNYLSSPIRIFDTRDGTGVTAGVINDGETRECQVAGVTKGAVSIPTGIVAVIGNLAVTSTANTSGTGGYLTLYPQGSPPPAGHETATINWFGANQSLNNGCTVRVNAGFFTVKNGILGHSSATHVIFDATAFIF